MDVQGASHERSSVEIPAESIAAAAIRASHTVQAVRRIEVLQDAARAVIEAARIAGCSQLVPVNAAAEPLATAAVLIGGGELTFSDADHISADRVLLVDAATVTGGSTRSCARLVRARGATWVAAAIYDRVRPDLDELEGDPLIDMIAPTYVPAPA
ncbi:hypothetical protein [Nocardioides sp.]|uniref:hypothetical protein n=1 Tax=Nocardioides sp. TaxID=35761 RepID=UPI0035196901